MTRKKTTTTFKTRPKKKAKVLVEPKEELAVKREERQTETPKEKLADCYSVYNKFNQFIRKYTVESHGDERKELAIEFSQKIGGIIKEQ